MSRVRDMNGFVYLATPYTNYPAGREQAYKDACAAAARLIKDGVRLYCPIAHTHPIAEHGCLDPIDHELWMRVDAPFMEAASALVVVCMQGWRESKGVSYERLYFKNRDKPIVYLRWPSLEQCDGGH